MRGAKRDPVSAFALRLLSACLLLAAAPPPAAAQEASFAYRATGRYRLVERSDFSKYVDGAYLGHVYRETRAVIEGEPEARGVRYRGGFLVFEETLRDASLVAKRVEAEIPADFLVAPDGKLTTFADSGYPSLRGFPAFPAGPVAVGDRWQAEGVRAVDPENRGKPTRIPLLAEYVYRGLSTYKGRSVHAVTAKYATRYKPGQDRSGDPELASASGTHDVDILVDAETGAPLLVRDSLDETFSYVSGRKVRLKGFLLVFYEAVRPLDYGASVAGLREALGGEEAGAVAAAPKVGQPGSGAAGASASGPAATSPGAAPLSGGPDPGAAAAGASGAGPASGAAAGPNAGPATSSGLSSAGPGPFLGGGETALDLGAGVSVERDPEGLLLTVKDLRFAADGDRVLPAEAKRLDAIAAALRGIEGRTFLVSGHTADVGRPADELALSIRRAKGVVDELVARGVPAARLLYRGFGATKPLAPNDTEANKARNRRVEILVLED